MGVAIRRAGEDDREAVIRLLDEAFQSDPVSSWVFPDAEHRRLRHPLLMGAFVDAVLAEGYVDVTEDGSACALWLSVPAEPAGEDDEDGPAQLRENVDPENERVELISRLTAGIHPEGQAHEYLWMIGVTPGRQGEGLGAALVQHVLDRCDGEGVAAYLEASSARSRGLYERLGFEFTGSALELPAGPLMWPMWREPVREPLRGEAGS
ncbi:GNAT superfamily N-acetyltransferase [Streptomyces umbrinus]|uniref:GNAT superfamily N-acetyltransferase n=1 Tax=Streptomyces umbrinus TaxID=67370 RepID=A0ABU0SRM6_9ACTN|nr:GNAT family N-acetyltransferase [Streptomyces umbrinus]MDQ1026203.1 GNAT superfamily N-acetyltransferase [Streptomyces umbrinus]